MMYYTFKTEKGNLARVRACDMKQAKILAIARHGRDFMWAKLISADNRF